MNKIIKFLVFVFIIVAVFAIILSFFIFKKSEPVCSHEAMTVSKTAPTCVNEGNTLHLCNDCGFSYVTDPTPKTDHNYTELKISPSCQSEGYTLFVCSCGDFHKGDILPTVAHTFTERTVSATCKNEGYTEHLCLVCAHSYSDAKTPKLAHSYKSTVQRPTALTAGSTKYLCECGDGYTDDIVPYSEILSSPYVESATVLTQGIDVSRWNHQIDPISGEYLPLDWQKIKNAGFDFVIIKAGSTRSGKEPTFEADYAGAKSAGLMVGAYFYTYSTTVEGVLNDASSLIKYIEGKQFEYPIYFDIEDPSLTNFDSTHLTKLCEVFICSMQENGYYSALYTNNDWLKNRLDSERVLSLFDIWYARYPLTDLPAWNEEKYGKTLSMWQYTQLGEIEGIDGYFDFNFCYRDYINIMKKWNLNGYFQS